MNLSIRRMAQEDISAVVALDQKSFSLPWPERSFRFELTDNPAARCWVAEHEGQVVAMIVVWLLVDEAHVATIATHPDYRRQGVASRLLAHALRHMLRDGARSSFLEVREGNLAAQAMYRKFGYEQAGRRRRYYRDNDEDAILMSLSSLDDEWLRQLEEQSRLDEEAQNKS